MIRPALALAALAAVAGCATTSQQVALKENELVAAGFTSRPANTPERQEMLARLPANRFVRRVFGERTSYVYADPKDCDCLYVGTERAYGVYLRHRQAQNLADEREMAAMDYADARWDWGAWGSWGGPWGGYGFRRGFGW